MRREKKKRVGDVEISPFIRNACEGNVHLNLTNAFKTVAERKQNDKDC